MFGAACVSRGYWFGQISIGGNTSVYAVVQGAVPEYSSSQPCPPQIMATRGGSDYALLKFHVAPVAEEAIFVDCAGRDMYSHSQH